MVPLRHAAFSDNDLSQIVRQSEVVSYRAWALEIIAFSQLGPKLVEE